MGSTYKATAVDPKLTNVSAKSESATRQWQGAAITMKQHIKIQPFLVDLVKDQIGKMQDHQECVEMSFMDKLQDHYRYMRNIRGCSEALQKPGGPLKECQLMLDILIGKVQGNHGCQETLFEKCILCLKYLSPKNGLSTNLDFETGIAKIQSGSEQIMTQAEKRACRAFQKDANLESDDELDLTVDSGKEDFFLREFEKAKKQKTKESIGQSDYIDCYTKPHNQKIPPPPPPQLCHPLFPLQLHNTKVFLDGFVAINFDWRYKNTGDQRGLCKPNEPSGRQKSSGT